MKTDHPSPRHMSQQRKLWQEAFGDTEAFLDSFFQTAYAPDRCLCILEGEQISAILYWIDCHQAQQKLAYIYAVVTRPDCRGRGLCRQLIADTHTHLQARGYAGALLVPQKESLRKMYAAMGYRNMGGLTVFSCRAGSEAVGLRAIGASEFAARRRALLPAGGIIQEGPGLAFLAQQLQFYAGDAFLLAAYTEKEILHGVELLGNPAAAPGILKALKLPEGRFRCPGSEIPFAMYHPLIPDSTEPEYLGFAFD